MPTENVRVVQRTPRLQTRIGKTRPWETRQGNTKSIKLVSTQTNTRGGKLSKSDVKTGKVRLRPTTAYPEVTGEET